MDEHLFKHMFRGKGAEIPIKYHSRQQWWQPLKYFFMITQYIRYTELLKYARKPRANHIPKVIPFSVVHKSIYVSLVDSKTRKRKEKSFIPDDPEPWVIRGGICGEMQVWWRWPILCGVKPMCESVFVWQACQLFVIVIVSCFKTF